MNKKEFQRYLREADFRGLFITEMGWNNPQGATDFDISVGEKTYDFRQVADRNGFQIITCRTEEIPSSAECRKIDTRLRRQANDYICIFISPETMHHLWLAPVKKVEKRDVVIIEYENPDQAEFLFEKADALSFDIGERTTIVDVKERVQAEFIINSEKLTKDFYSGFRKEHTNFTRFISGINDNIEDKKNRDKQWYTSVMLNRLMFCYFIQKKGFLDGNVNYLREKLEWVKKEKGADRFYDSFYKGFLVSLFHDGLNSPRHQDGFREKYGRIPYLNGGMFDIHQLEQQYEQLDIADEAFDSLFAFFDKWHWHLDDRLTASGRDINPDVLGYIFEQYINDRAAMGAYYTKEDITEYIGRNTILPFLIDDVRKKDEAPFRTGGAVWQMLRESGDRYVFDAVKKGADRQNEIPGDIACGIDTAAPDLIGRRKNWNKRTLEPFALPTEIWRETIERFARYNDICRKISSGEVEQINDFITYNLDIRSFVADMLTKTDDHRLILHFYQSLRNITILDPTCGSGAFLFAALNILEPLYEICIGRMQEFNESNNRLFSNELEEINRKYRSNIQYFIYKSIILRNLYGVDIMAEAVEIAKLRLFLKMVAVVEVNPRDPNLGLDPLPDIDFNIRCGNTLVGYATKREMDSGVQTSDFFAAQEFRQKADDEMDKVAKTYQRFKEVQLTQTEDPAAFKNAKAELKKRLQKLDNLLNRNMYKGITGRDVEEQNMLTDEKYQTWVKSHQPFHWIAEFYDIVQGHGGFDVIIGNPPYVEMSKIDYLKNNKEFSCSDLYGHVIRRVMSLMQKQGTHGFIVMHNLAFSKNFSDVRKILLEKEGDKWFSFYGRIPAGLFAGDVRVRNCIYVLNNIGQQVYTTRLHRWFAEQREALVQTIKYSKCNDVDCIPMLNSSHLQSVYEDTISSNGFEDKINGTKIYFKQSAYNWLAVSLDEPPAYDKDGNKISQSMVGTVKVNRNFAKIILLFFCGKLSYTKWLSYGDEFHLTLQNLLSFPFPFEDLSEEENAKLNKYADEFIAKLPSTVQFKLNAGKNVGTYNTAKLWYITDKSDAIFLNHLTDRPIEMWQEIENFIACSVITGKKE